MQAPGCVLNKFPKTGHREQISQTFKLIPPEGTCISQFLIFLATLLLYDLKTDMTKLLVKQEIMPRFFFILKKNLK